MWVYPTCYALLGSLSDRGGTLAHTCYMDDDSNENSKSFAYQNKIFLAMLSSWLQMLTGIICVGVA